MDGNAFDRYLAGRGLRFEAVVIGGTALNLLGVVSRATRGCYSSSARPASGKSIKRSLERQDFQVDARLLRRALLDNGYSELPITSEHAVNIDHLPPTHKDPFDRILVAQATVELVSVLEAIVRLEGESASFYDALKYGLGFLLPNPELAGPAPWPKGRTLEKPSEDSTKGEPFPAGPLVLATC